MAMKSPQRRLSWLLLLLFITCVSATGGLRLGVVERRIKMENKQLDFASANDLKTFFHTQTLDHFNYKPESYTTFQQRYVVNFKHWGGASSSAPIFVLLGEESPLDSDIGPSFVESIAPRFKALVLYIEHRYYGKSIPFGSRKEAFQNASTLGYFSSSQALVDYAEVIIGLKKNLSAEASPVIVFGGSYGGMLAAWFRLKYPHVAIGALASSAPILYFDDITPQDGYYSIISKSFKDTSENCYNTIKQVWSKIDKLASNAKGLKILSHKFNTCQPLNKSSELKDYLDSSFSDAAQYNSPSSDYPVSLMCKAIDEASKGTTDILSRVFAGVTYKNDNKSACVDINLYKAPSESLEGWAWQTCSEMAIPAAHGTRKESMFPADTFNFTSFTEDCKEQYGVSPRPHWITTQFGGHDIKRVLKKFGSNIIFSNGLRDPYSSGGVLESISPSLIAIYTKQGSHCLDITNPSPKDPRWLVKQRNQEIKIISRWLAMYNMDLAAKL